jgi:protein-S-isoprenylcysteine O-methyltransferase Ste14
MRSGQATTAFTVPGAVPLLLLLPVLAYYLWWCVVSRDGALVAPGPEFWRAIPPPTLRSALILGGWLLFQALLQAWAPGPWAEGPPLGDGRRLRYRMNGWWSWWITWAALLAVVGAAGAVGGRDAALSAATAVADEFGPLMSTANLFAFAFGVYLYMRGRRHPDDGTPAGTGHVLRDYVMGTSLNPRQREFDWKVFFEGRPGLIGWAVLDLSLAAKQYQAHGEVTTPMLLVCAFQLWYVVDYFYHEEAILTTWDIKHETFGWMLCWGDLVWVPFTYTLPALYLVNRSHGLPIWAVLGVAVLFFAGYAISRGANDQKHAFRQDPAAPLKWWGGPPRYVPTRRGPPLLASGLWGVGRHLNYLGDLMMGLAWCLPCGFGRPIPYFYVVYLAVLLVHRERRDHARCAANYGEDWEAYCAKVRWRIVPGLY